VGGELLSFDEALAELQMATHELRSLVAQGEIRAFRDDDSLKFRRTDVLDLKKSRETHTEGLLIEPDEFGDETLPSLDPDETVPGPEVKSAKHETEETELLTGIGQDAPADFLGLDETTDEDGGGVDTAQTVVPTIEIADEDTIDDTARTVIPTLSAEDDTDLLSDSDTGAPPSAPTLLVEEDEATEMATQEINADDLVAPTAPVGSSGEDTRPGPEPLRFQDTSVGTDELEITTDEASASATAGVTAPRRSQQYQDQAAAVTVSPLFLALAIVTFVVLLFGVPIFYGLATDKAPDFSPYRGLIEFLTEKTVK
jgi:hypothetical protein